MLSLVRPIVAVLPIVSSNGSPVRGVTRSLAGMANRWQYPAADRVRQDRNAGFQSANGLHNSDAGCVTVFADGRENDVRSLRSADPRRRFALRAWPGRDGHHLQGV